MKTKLLSLIGVLAIGACISHASQTESPKMNGKLKVTTLSPEEIRYTGKPYIKELGAYAFNCRNYDPGTSRWTTSDPSGFPDKANNRIYSNNPINVIDSSGLTLVTINSAYVTYATAFYTSDTGLVSFQYPVMQNDVVTIDYTQTGSGSTAQLSINSVTSDLDMGLPAMSYAGVSLTWGISTGNTHPAFVNSQGVLGLHVYWSINEAYNITVAGLSVYNSTETLDSGEHDILAE